LRYRALTKRKYRRLFSSNVPKKPGPKGPTQDVIVAVIDMRRRDPTCGCPRIAQQIALAFGIPINKDVVQRILAARYRPAPDSAGSTVTARRRADRTHTRPERHRWLRPCECQFLSMATTLSRAISDTDGGMNARSTNVPGHLPNLVPCRPVERVVCSTF
jgi:hypothetical protein